MLRRGVALPAAAAAAAVVLVPAPAVAAASLLVVTGEKTSSEGALIELAGLGSSTMFTCMPEERRYGEAEEDEDEGEGAGDAEGSAEDEEEDDLNVLQSEDVPLVDPRPTYSTCFSAQVS